MWSIIAAISAKTWHSTLFATKDIMKHIAIGLAFLHVFVPSCQMTIKPLDDIWVLPSDPWDEQTQSRIGRLQEYMQHKIMEQNKALGRLLQLSQTNEVLIKKLIKYCRPFLERLKTPDKVEIFLPNRRSNTHQNHAENKKENWSYQDKTTSKEIDVQTFFKEEETPIISMIKFGRRMPTLGKLVFDVISNEFSGQLEPLSELVSST